MFREISDRRFQISDLISDLNSDLISKTLDLFDRTLQRYLKSAI